MTSTSVVRGGGGGGGGGGGEKVNQWIADLLDQLRPGGRRVIAAALAAAAAALLFTRWKKTRRERLELEARLPPLYGASMFENLKKFGSKFEMPGCIYDMYKEMGPIFRVNLQVLAGTTICVADPKIQRLILAGDKDCSELDKSQAVLKPFTFLTNGLPNIFMKSTFATGPHDGWAWSRKAMSPAFSMANLKKKTALLQAKSEDFNRVLGTAEEVDLCFVCLRVTMDVLCSTMFDIEVGACSNDRAALGNRILDMFRVANEEMMRMYNPLRQYMFWDGERRKALKACKELNEIALGLIESYRKKHSKEYISSDLGILGHLVRAPYASDEARAADAVVYLLAGHDTTGFTIAWTLLELSRHPAEQARLQDELDAANPSRSPWTCQELETLPLLEATLQESMRLWPVAGSAIVGRVTDRDIEVGNAMMIPRHSLILCNTATSMRGDTIKEPDEWRPNRWMDPSNSDAAALRALYMPFGHGKRICIGANLALLEMKMLLAGALQHFSFELLDPGVPECFVTLKPSGAKVKASRRDVKTS